MLNLKTVFLIKSHGYKSLKTFEIKFLDKKNNNFIEVEVQMKKENENENENVKSEHDGMDALSAAINLLFFFVFLSHWN